MTNKSIPTYEKPISEKLVSIYSVLSELKNNRNRYINSKQVYQIYDEFLNILHELSLTRKDEELKGINLNLPNGNDFKIDDIWQLLSLCFVTCGLIKFAPATYSSLSTVYKLLGHLKEGKAYTIDELEPIKKRLIEFKDIIENSYQDQDENKDLSSTQNHKIEESIILRNKLNKCQALYKELENNFDTIPSDLESVYKELAAMRKSLLAYLTTATSTSKEELARNLDHLRSMLKDIESKRDEEGRFRSEIATPDELNSTQIVLNGLIDDCHNFIYDVSIQNNTTDLSNLINALSITDESSEASVKGFKEIYNELIDLKSKLENLLITRRWTMRETDLYSYQKSLKKIDEQRIILNGSTDQSNKHIKRFQVLILYLLRRCYAVIYKLLESSEPVSESLQPIHNQLSTVRRCLLEIKRVDGLNNLRELYPFQFKLASLDNLREDGKFIINGQIPEGQGTLNALLAECFDIMHELKIELEEKEEEREYSESAGPCDDTNLTDDEDKGSDDEVELKRSRFVGFNEADYDQDVVSEYSDFSDSEYETNDYY